MANEYQKLTDRTELAEAPASGDFFHVVDVSDTTDSAEGTSKKVQAQYLTISDASTLVKGKVELATDAETITGTDAVRAVTPSSITAKQASDAETITGSSTTKILTPANITAKIDTDGTLAGNLDTRIPSQKAVKSYGDRALNALLTRIPLYAPQGFLINGKIVPSVASNNLTVAIKTLAGTDPSATDPVYVRIGDTVRTISAALSVTKNAATNWMNAGSAELATKEIDYFVYLGYNATDGVVIGFSRFPGASQYSDFSETTTNEKYCAISTITTAASTDYYEVVGRFAATLSAGAGYTWSVPTFTAINLIQRPIYETRWLTFAPTFAGWSANPTVDWATYRLQYSTLNIRIGCSAGTSNATTATVIIPFAVLNYPVGVMLAINAGTILATPAKWSGTPGSSTLTLYKDCANAAWTNSGAKSFLIENMVIAI